MRLVSVDAVTATDDPTLFTLSLTADFDDGRGVESGNPYGWRRGASGGEIWEEIDAFMASHPNIPVAPVPPRALPVLQPYQFFAMIEISGHTAALNDFISRLPSPANVIDRAKLDHAPNFRRVDDIVLKAQQGVGISDAEFDEMWLQAALF